MRRIRSFFSPPHSSDGPDAALVSRVTARRDELVHEFTPLLRDAEPDHVKALIRQAEEGARAQSERAQGAERRATTLQSALSIGVTFVLASAGFALGSNRVDSSLWRVGLLAALLLIVVALAASALRASQATSTIHSWNRPHLDSSVRYRATLSPRDAQIHELSSLIYAIENNRQIAHWKLQRLQEALRLFRTAIALLVVLAALFVAYAASSTGADSDPPDRPTNPSRSTSDPEPR